MKLLLLMTVLIIGCGKKNKKIEPSEKQKNEIANYHSDSDYDGISNALEKANRTNPFIANLPIVIQEQDRKKHSFKFSTDKDFNGVLESNTIDYVRDKDFSFLYLKANKLLYKVHNNLESETLRTNDFYLKNLGCTNRALKFSKKNITTEQIIKYDNDQTVYLKNNSKIKQIKSKEDIIQLSNTDHCLVAKKKSIGELKGNLNEMDKKNIQFWVISPKKEELFSIARNSFDEEEWIKKYTENVESKIRFDDYSQMFWYKIKDQNNIILLKTNLKNISKSAEQTVLSPVLQSLTQKMNLDYLQPGDKLILKVKHYSKKENKGNHKFKIHGDEKQCNEVIMGRHKSAQGCRWRKRKKACKVLDFTNDSETHNYKVINFERDLIVNGEKLLPITTQGNESIFEYTVKSDRPIEIKVNSFFNKSVKLNRSRKLLTKESSDFKCRDFGKHNQIDTRLHKAFSLEAQIFSFE